MQLRIGQLAIVHIFNPHTLALEKLVVEIIAGPMSRHIDITGEVLCYRQHAVGISAWDSHAGRPMVFRGIGQAEMAS